MSDLEKARPWIEAALEYGGGTHEWEDIVKSLCEGKMQLWVGDKSAAITEILSYPKKKVLHVFLAGGDMNELISMINDASEWGKLQKCVSMTISGRRGWERVLGKVGWKAKMIVMEKEI
jgi:hypothetical protein